MNDHVGTDDEYPTPPVTAESDALLKQAEAAMNAAYADKAGIGWTIKKNCDVIEDDQANILILRFGGVPSDQGIMILGLFNTVSEAVKVAEEVILIDAEYTDVLGAPNLLAVYSYVCSHDTSEAVRDFYDEVCETNPEGESK